MPGKLSYFGLGGRAESIRALCAHANIDYENNIVTSNQEMKDSGYSPMGGLPVWKEDGFVVCQCNSIMRFVGMQHGYYSTDPQVCFNIDSLKPLAPTGLKTPAIKGLAPYFESCTRMPT